MARSGFLRSVVREIERSNREATRRQRQGQQIQRRWERERLRQNARDERERAQFYAESRLADADDMTTEAQMRIAEFTGLLTHTLSVDDWINLDTLKHALISPTFDAGELGEPFRAPCEDDFLPPPPSGLGRFVPGATARYEREVSAGRERFAVARAQYERDEAQRLEALASARASREREIAESNARLAEQNSAIDDLRDRLDQKDPAAVVEYLTMVLENSSYPDGVTHHAKLAYVPDSAQLVIELELPSFDIVPIVESYKYVKSRDDYAEKMLSDAARRSLYESVLAQMTLRTLHEVFEADRGSCVDTVVFNGHVSSIDRGTGQPVRPCVISLRCSRQTFDGLDLSRVEPGACLKALNAAVSKRPTELAPVRPVIEFSMVDPRFIQEADVLAGLDQRSNLMELSPGEFESLITNLFERMGLETRQTVASRDGGVDCVAFDARPIFGGKVVIQAKRYKGTVGVSAVRDLFGTLQNEGASKGILVTTSGYGAASYEFANGKPIELLDGANLLYLLAEHAGIEAKIEPPEGWSDPT